MTAKRSGSLFFCLLLLTGNGLYSQQPKLVLPIGHTMRVNTAVFSPDGKKIVTASYDHTAKIWDASSGLLLGNLDKHTAIVNMAQFSPACPSDPAGGKYIVTASADSTARIWDSNTGALLRNLAGHHDKVLWAEFSPDGKKIVTASDDHTAIIWDVLTGDPLQVLRGHRYTVYAAHFSPSCANDPTGGKKIITCSRDSKAIIWDTQSGDSIAVLNGHRSFVLFAGFSPDGNKIITASRDGLTKIWKAATGEYLVTLDHTYQVNMAQFSPSCADDPAGGKYIVTANLDNTAMIWNSDGKLLTTLTGHKSAVLTACFSPDGKKIVTASAGKTAKVWDLSGTVLATLSGHKSPVLTACFSPDGKKIVTASMDRTVKIFDAGTGILMNDLKGHSSMANSVQFSPDGEKMLSTYADNTVKVWDVINGKVFFDLKNNDSRVNHASFSPDGKRIIASFSDSTAIIYDAVSGAGLKVLKGHTDIVNFALYSPDGKKIVTVSHDMTARLWEAESGALLKTLIGHSGNISSAQFSPISVNDPAGGKTIMTISDDGTAISWNTATGEQLKTLSASAKMLYMGSFSNDGKKFLTCSWDATAIVWDAVTGDKLQVLKGGAYAVKAAYFSPDGNQILTISKDNNNVVKLWNANTGESLFNLAGHKETLNAAQFSPDGKKILTASADGTIILWESSSGKILKRFEGHNAPVYAARFSPKTPDDPQGGKTIVSISNDNTTKVWNTETGKLQYTFIAVDSTDYLVVDKDGHYDGTAAARRLLYYTCGTELIELQQLKDKLWVDGLAEQINKGQPVTVPTLQDLNICDLIPVVEDVGSEGIYKFKITPKRGGLGETVLFINNNETKRYKINQLTKTATGYELTIPKELLQPYLVAGSQNLVTVKSYTANNDIISRGIKIGVNTTDTTTKDPDLYAVIVGVSDYSAAELHLNYAAKDAKDIGNAVTITAGKLFDKPGQRHVFVYDFNTDSVRYGYPNKKNIRHIFDTIASKATANDILLVFFAGHGTVAEDKNNQKQFYFLTSDASSFNDPEASGISTAELIEWIHPQRIKAQKRILILDACNSGQALNDISQNKDLMAVRGNTANGDAKKEIERLNDQAGMFILSASASNQSAYELGRYSQGLLTYTLLKAIKQQPDILEDDIFLNLSRWFGAAKRSVTDIMNQMGKNGRQEAQLVANTDFNIGIVDPGVLGMIKMADEKPMFTSSQFVKAGSHSDELQLRLLVDKELAVASSRGKDNEIVYRGDYEGQDAYSLSGDYKVEAGKVTVSISLLKGGNEIKLFEVKGITDKIPQLAKEIIKTATAWLAGNK